MEGRKLQFGRIAFAAFALLLMSTPAFAQEGGGGGLDLIAMFQSMGPAAIAVAVILFIMSFWSVGVAIERIYTFNQARSQSKAYAPRVAKHLKDGRLMGSCCKACGQTSFPPRADCEACLGSEFDFVERSGRARLLTYTRIVAAPSFFRYSPSSGRPVAATTEKPSLARIATATAAER